jgi:hypothetical protein
MACPLRAAVRAAWISCPSQCAAPADVHCLAPASASFPKEFFEEVLNKNPIFNRIDKQVAHFVAQKSNAREVFPLVFALSFSFPRESIRMNT